jgi:glycosyltransferase involved in cell wall biosynthesis
MSHAEDFPQSTVLSPCELPAVVLPPLPMAVETVPVLHLINGEHYAGAERVQDLLARGLPEFGYCVGFACVKLSAFDAMRESRESPLYDVPMRTKFDLRAAAKVARRIREGGYRILHAHTVRTALVGGLAAAISRVPMVYHAHSPTLHNTTGGWRDWIGGIVERQSLRSAARVIAVSQAIAEHIAAEGYDTDRIRVVLNGVPEVAAPADRPVPSGCWTLGVVALFRPRKGIEVLLEAMAILHRQGVPVHLRAVGTFESPAYEAEILACVDRFRLNEHVTWIGFIRDVTAELQKMDLFVLPSLFGEGLPMVVLEAMAAGTPVVATRVSGTPEAIRHGRDGVLVEPGNAHDLAQKVADVIGGQYDWGRLRASALERHAKRFSDRVMAAGVAAVYREVLDSKQQ